MKKSVELPDGQWADAVVLVDASTGQPSSSSSATGTRPLIDALATIHAVGKYVKVPPASTNLVLSGGAGGAFGDTLSKLVITVTAEATSTISLTDGSGAGIVLNTYPILPANMGQGTYTVDMGDIESMDGPWKITTGAGVNVIAIGIFS